MARPVTITKTLAAASSNNIAASQGPVTGAFTINGSAATGGVATLDTSRRVIVTSAGNDSGITFLIKGTNTFGNKIQETITGANIGAAQSSMNYFTITSITSSGATASTVTAGTNGVGSTQWVSVSPHMTPTKLSIACVVTGTVNYTVEYTYNDPNYSPTSSYAYALDYVVPDVWADSLVTGATGNAIATQDEPIMAARVTINSGTGSVKAVFIQAGIAGS